MYTLRRISGQGVEMNHALGQNYTVVSFQNSPETFKADWERFYNEPWSECLKPDNPTAYAFVSNEDGSVIQPLYHRQQAYIMTDAGKTFSNLTYKDYQKKD